MREYNDNNIRIIEEKGIFFMDYKIEKIDIQIARDIVDKRIKFTKKNGAILFINASNLKSIDCESRNYFVSNEASIHLCAIAIYANTNYTKFLIVFMLTINGSVLKLPIELFFNKKKALSWLNFQSKLCSN